MRRRERNDAALRAIAQLRTILDVAEHELRLRRPIDSVHPLHAAVDLVCLLLRRVDEEQER